MLRRARRERCTLVIGIDADARAMADASRRAAAKASKGGLPNAIFLAESAEQLPGQLSDRADLVAVALPWGSLFHGLLDADCPTLASLSGCLKPGAELVLFLSELTESQVEDLVTRSESAGLERVEVRPATLSDTAELSSGWARRLRIPGSRPVWIIRLRRCDRTESRR